MRFYLGDTAGINGKLFSLGLIVASQTVIFLFCLIHFPVIMGLNTVLNIFSPAFCDFIIMHMAD